ncbi:chymotrypsin family serine protease [Oerskovia merdavium]|uniref:Trypsin-like serine protease n=1 Tax=Oerskovia merdavium TaxID=2762227 RepID=A0ABR8TZY7_9CELL|nr:hypothetical protein [Oerskovia merdavium]MBD7981324.1 hypothetical protein [Oerskovia merdavium]
MAALGLGAITATAGEAAPSPQADTPGKPDPKAVIDPNSLGDLLTLPPIPEDLAEEAERIQAAYGKDDRFGAVAISDDRAELSLTWYGELPTDIVASPELAIVEAAVLPGDLRRAAQNLAGTEVAGVRVVGAGVNTDGSGIAVDVETSTSTSGRSARSQINEDLAADLADRTGVPVTVKEAPEVDASVGRHKDNLHLGGARITQFSNGYLYQSCSTGFSAQRYLDNAYGMLFAAHCGLIGSEWVRTEISEGGVLAYNYGLMVNRTLVRDSGIMTTDWSYPYVYVGDYESEQFIGVEAVASSYVVGMEICSSGSYSGLACGGKVTSLDYYVDYPESDIDNAKVAVIIDASGKPLWGNGDSGGPIFDLVQASTGLKRRAVGIVSGIYTTAATDASNCQGVPGVPAGVAGRHCSPNGFGAYAKESADIFGWRILTQSTP